MTRKRWIFLSGGVFGLVVVISTVAYLRTYAAPRLTPAEQELIDITNAARVLAQAPRLQADAALCAAARAQARRMAREGYTAPERKTITKDLEAAGYQAEKWGWTAARESGLDPARAHVRMFTDPAGRGEMANPLFADAGAGVAPEADGEHFIYFQIFAKR
jgi:uncharacterized protein YkwD